MSLDVYIKNKKKEEDREWVANITHNMNKMAQRIFVSENKEIMFGDQKNCIKKYIPMR